MARLTHIDADQKPAWTKSPNFVIVNMKRGLLRKIRESGISDTDRDTYFIELAKRMPFNTLRAAIHGLEGLKSEADWLRKIWQDELSHFGEPTEMPPSKVALPMAKKPTKGKYKLHLVKIPADSPQKPPVPTMVQVAREVARLAITGRDRPEKIEPWGTYTKTDEPTGRLIHKAIDRY